MDKETFDAKLKSKFSEEHYTVLYYGKNSYENSVLQCLDCGRRIEVNTGELFRARRKHICSKCHYKRKDTKRNEIAVSERLTTNGHELISFFMKERKELNIMLLVLDVENAAISMKKRSRIFLDRNMIVVSVKVLKKVKIQTFLYLNLKSVMGKVLL